MFNINPAHYETGDLAALKSWLDASTLDASARQALLQFAEQFPAAPFYRYIDLAFQPWSGPGWLQEIWSAFAFVWPDKILNIKLERQSEDEDAWFQLYLGKFLSDTSFLGLQDDLRKSGLNALVIGEDLTDPGAILLVEDQTPAIYHLHIDDISYFQRKKLPLREALGTLYDDYYAMINDIAAIRELTGKGKSKMLRSR